jgi:MFS family permease
METTNKSLRPQFFLFLAAVACMAAASNINDSIFNNFLSDTFKLTAGGRGWLELPRELPGFLVVAMTGLLAALPVTRLGAVGAFGYVCGAIGLALFGSSYWPMVGMMMISSCGAHLTMPVTSSIALALGNENNRGRRMGQTGVMETLGVILGTGFVWIFFDKHHPQYQLGFFCAAAVAAGAGIIYTMMHIPHLHQPRAKIVFKKKYWLYYSLELLFGARKQIFITFGPWVLITVYHRPANSIANLLMIAAIIGIAFKPLVGMAIDRFGERKLMIIDGLALIFVCLGYGYAGRVAHTPVTALLIASGCYIADNLLFALGSARAIYLSRMTTDHQEITSTLAMGVTINHMVSMTIPALAGIIWIKFGYERVFLAASVLAILVSLLALWVPGKKTMASKA